MKKGIYKLIEELANKDISLYRIEIELIKQKDYSIPYIKRSISSYLKGERKAKSYNNYINKNKLIYLIENNDYNKQELINKIKVL